MPAHIDATTKPKKIEQAVLKIARHILAFLRRTLWYGAGEWHLTLSTKQQAQNWTSFDEYITEKAPSITRDSFYNRPLFDSFRWASIKRRLKISTWRILAWASLITGAIFVGLVLKGTIYFENWVCLPFALATVFIALIELDSKNRSEISAGQLAANVEDDNRSEAEIFLVHLEKDILPKHRFTVKDRAGNFQELPQDFTTAENYLLFLFGETRDRRAIPFVGKYPKGKLYFSVTTVTKDTRPGDELLEFLRNEKELRRFYDYVKSFEGQDPTKPGSNLSVSRKSWLNIMQVMLDDFKLWLQVSNRESSTKERQNFEKCIKSALSQVKFIKDLDSAYLEFINGENRNFNKWRKDVLEIKK